MKQVNLMEYLTNIKLLKENAKKEIADNCLNDNNTTEEIAHTERVKLCNTYLIRLLYKYYKHKNEIVADALLAIIDNGPRKKLFFSSYKFIDIERNKLFVYQTCLNFVEEYSDFILTPKLSKQVKEELIIKAFLYSDFYDKLIQANRGIESIENGCYVSIDLHEISK